jgi:hypothetical protein
MKSVTAVLSLAALIVTCSSFSGIKNTNGEWSNWRSSNCYQGLDFSVKKGDYNEYAHKYMWYIRFRNRYNETI